MHSYVAPLDEYNVDHPVLEDRCTAHPLELFVLGLGCLFLDLECFLVHVVCCCLMHCDSVDAMNPGLFMIAKIMVTPAAERP